MELVVIRRLFYAPRVIVLVATIGIAGLALAIVTAYPEITDFSAPLPAAIDTTWSDVAGVQVTGAQLAVLVVVPLVAIALGWFLNRTLLGRTVKASAENPDLARVQGINPKIVSTAVWAIAGFLATITMMLVAGRQRWRRERPAHLGPNTLVRALAAAVIAGMVSFPRAMVAGVVIGVVQALVNFNYLDKPGLIDGLLLVAVLDRGGGPEPRPRPGGDADVLVRARRCREIPDQLRDVWWVRRLNLVVLGRCWWRRRSRCRCSSPHPRASCCTRSIGCFAICGLSLTVLTGWAGQLSLGQMAFAGFGALLAAARRAASIRPGRRRRLDFAALAVRALDRASRRSLTAGLAVLIGVGCAACTRAAARGQHVRVRGGGAAVLLPPAGAVGRPDLGARSRAARCSGSTSRRSAPTTTSCSGVLVVAVGVREPPATHPASVGRRSRCATTPTARRRTR